MSHFLRRTVWAAGLALGGLFEAGAAAAQSLTINTDSYPIAYLAERLAGDRAEIVLPVPVDRDPAFWTPSIAAITDYQQADVILLNGASFAAWTTQATLPRGRIVDTSIAFADRFIATEGVTHSHGPEGEHSHTAVASFTWLDFGQAALQADAIAADLKRRLPDAAATIDANLATLSADLAALNAEAAEIGAAAAGRTIIASHPRYQYFARAYGLAIESVEWESGEVPTPEQLAELDALLAAHPATLMLWEAEPSPEAVAALADRGLASIVFATAANRPLGTDFLAVMQDNLDRLRGALTGL